MKLYILFMFNPVLLASAQTYYTQNKDAETDIYTPCNQITNFSMCCRTQAVGTSAQDAYLKNGLYLNTGGEKISTGYTYWRESCNDPTWSSPYCLTFLNTCGVVSTILIAIHASSLAYSFFGFSSRMSMEIRMFLRVLMIRLHFALVQITRHAVIMELESS
jgi:hypothetical protein